MIIGILSDTHDDLVSIKKAVALFEKNKVELILHAGDWTGIYAFNFLVNLTQETGIPVKGVLGNNDQSLELLLLNGKVTFKNIFLTLGLLDLTVDNRRIALTHGDNKNLMTALKENRHDVVISGHSHRPSVKEDNGILFINPGSTAFSVPRKKNAKTVALYNSTTNSANICTLL